MGRHLLCVVVLAVLGAAPAASWAQTPAGGTLREQIDALKAEVAAVREMAVQAPAVAEAAEDLAGRVTALEQQLTTLSSQVSTAPDAVQKIDELERDARTLRLDVENLRTRLADIEQPAAVSDGAGGVTHDDGYQWATGDGRYSVKLAGYVQPRLQLDFPEDFSTIDSATFRLRRGRVGFSGHAGSPELTYKILFELVSDSAPALDYYIDHEIMPWLTVRAGQTKIQYTRNFLTSSSRLDFVERSSAVEALRYDRDIGLWVHGQVLDDKLGYYAGFSNGAGRNKLNDNIDFVSMVRVDFVALGKRFKPSYGDQNDTEEPTLIIGGGFLHDLVRVPELVAGIEVGQRDVDADGVLDNVRVMSAGLDAIFRIRGFEAAAELMYRQERWGTILQHADNSELADVVAATSKGRRNYLGAVAQATYFAVPETLLFGLRASHVRMPVLGVGGRGVDSVPTAERLLQLDVLAQLYENGYRRIGLMYSFLNWGAVEGPDPDLDKEHRILLEAQLVL